MEEIQARVQIAYYPIRKRPIPLVVLMFLIAACVYGLLYPFLQTGIVTRWWYHVTSSLPLVSDAPAALPADKQGYVALAQADARASGIPPDLFVKQINQESGFNPGSLSPAGAEGIAQFMPGTADEMGIDPWNPVQSLQAAAQYMAAKNRLYGGDYAKALASYNAGSGTVASAESRCGDAWLSCTPAETQAYVQKIMTS